MQRGHRSALMVGTSFYKSVQDPALLEAVGRGVELRYVFLNPGIEDELLWRIAGAFGQDAEDLRSELSNTYYGLKSVYCKLLKEDKEGHLNVRVLDESIGTRMYFYDVSDGKTAKGTDVVAFVVPYVHGHDSPNLPGFQGWGRRGQDVFGGGGGRVERGAALGASNVTAVHNVAGRRAAVSESLE